LCFGFVKVKLSAKKDKVNAGISKQLQEQKDAAVVAKEAIVTFSTGSLISE
jgi:hypothetical protein